jgi:hypothetical protein
MMLANGSAALKFPRPLPAVSLLPGRVINLDIRLRLRRIITGGLLHFV